MHEGGAGRINLAWGPGGSWIRENVGRGVIEFFDKPYSLSISTDPVKRYGCNSCNMKFFNMQCDLMEVR